MVGRDPIKFKERLAQSHPGVIEPAHYRAARNAKKVGNLVIAEPTDVFHGKYFTMFGFQRLQGLADLLVFLLLFQDRTGIRCLNRGCRIDLSCMAVALRGSLPGKHVQAPVPQYAVEPRIEPGKTAQAWDGGERPCERILTGIQRILFAPEES